MSSNAATQTWLEEHVNSDEWLHDIIEEEIKQRNAKIISDEAIQNYNKAVGKGILKVMNKIGISTLNSYRGSQLFECIGINSQVVDEFFPNTTTRIQGIDLYQIEREISKRYYKAFVKKTIGASLDLEIGVQYRWRRNG